jgi:hypothetical protein
VLGGKKKDKTKSPAKRGVKGLVLFATLGWVVVSLLVADKIHAKNMNGALHNALVRSQSARQLLWSELKQKSSELEALEKRLSRYQTQESKATVNP